MRPTFEERHDWRKDRHGIDRQHEIAWAIAGVWFLILGMLALLAFLETHPTFGKLNGCEAFPTECAAYAQERSR